MKTGLGFRICLLCLEARGFLLWKVSRAKLRAGDSFMFATRDSLFCVEFSNAITESNCVEDEGGFYCSCF